MKCKHCFFLRLKHRQEKKKKDTDVFSYCDNHAFFSLPSECKRVCIQLLDSVDSWLLPRACEYAWKRVVSVDRPSNGFPQPHPPTLRLNNPTETELFNSGILHSPLPTWREFTAGGPCVYVCVCVCVCEGAGGWFRAWVRLSTLLLFDGTQRAFIHYSWHAEGATLGQGFGKSTPEPVIMSSAHVCGGVCVCACACMCFTSEETHFLTLPGLSWSQWH